MCWLRLQLFVAAHHNMKVQGSRQNQEEGRLIKKEKVDNKRNRESESPGELETEEATKGHSLKHMKLSFLSYYHAAKCASESECAR